uniref:Alpha-catenin n=1 Tax=Timema poppense TaxID=170557 RepID=A0A7R9H600_TIMPO|nr:unnamed protein product [Timema poppensis]
MGTKEQSEGLERALDHMCRKTRDLRRQLRKAVVDHVSDREDSFQNKRVDTCYGEEKEVLYGAYFVHIITYAAETLTLIVRETRKVEAMGMKFVRSMLAIMRKNEVRNEALWGRVGVQRVHEIVDEATLRWYEHVMRMEKERMAKKMLKMKYLGKNHREAKKEMKGADNRNFLETNVPLLVLIEAAKAGNEKEVEEYALVFTEHANKLVEVANLACSMSGNEDGVKMVRYAAAQIENLCPQVINAARILAARPRSKVAQENMDVFKDAWENQVRILTEAVDDITTIDDFLAVSENHILEDVNKCVLALQEGDADTLDRTAGAIRGRSSRVCNVVGAEMDNYEPGIYTERVLEAVKVLRDQVMPNFAQRVEVAVDALSSNPAKDVDENEFIDASRLVYDGVREIRRAVLMNRTDEELDPEDVEFDEHYTIETRSKCKAHLNLGGKGART